MRGGGYRLGTGLASLQIESVAEPATSLSGCTLRDLATQSEVHPEYIRFLCHVGFLPWTRGRYNSMLISYSDAERFIKTYAFVGPLARSLGHNPTDLAAKLESLGIMPVSGPSLDGGLCYLFRLDDLCGVQIESLDSMESYPTRAGRKPKELSPRSLQGVPYTTAATQLKIKLGMIVRLVGNGVLVQAPGRSREKRIDIESLRRLEQDLADPSYLSELDAMARLGETRSQLMRRWVDTGVMRVRNLILVRQYRSSEVEHVAELKLRYELTSDLARDAEVIRTHFVNQARIGRYPAPSRISGASATVLLFPKAGS